MEKDRWFWERDKNWDVKLEERILAGGGESRRLGEGRRALKEGLAIKKWEKRKQYLGEDLENSAKQAIRDVYAKTFAQQQSTTQPIKTNNIVNTK